MEGIVMGKKKDKRELEKFRQEERQKEQRSDIAKAVWGALLLIGLGLLLLLRPDFGTNTVALILGWVLIAVGAIGVLVCLLSWPLNGVTQLVLSIAVTGFGIFILLKPHMLISIFGICLGIYLILQGISALLESLKLKKLGYGFRLNLIAALVTLVLGIVLLFFPMDIAHWAIRMIGGIMVLCGVSNLLLRTGAVKDLGQPRDVVDADE